MVTFFEANLAKLAVHYVGNPSLDEGYVISENEVDVTDDIKRGLIFKYLLSPFQKTVELFEFFHPSEDLEMNDAYVLCKQLFEDQGQFQTVSAEFAKLLHFVSSNPRIKCGDLYVTLFENVQIEGELLQAIGIFKSETKETYLKVSNSIGATDVIYEQNAVNINNLEKGCLIFNTDAESGYKVAVINNSGNSESSYWTDEFLQLRVRKDNYQSTANMLAICKQFITNEIDDEFEVSNGLKIALLNRTLKYFNEKEEFDLEEFKGEVLSNQDVIDAFESYKTRYADEYELDLPETFAISTPAIKRQGRAYKKVIRLDKNFQLQISGDSSLVERGFDGEKGLNYYKVYFKEEVI